MLYVSYLIETNKQSTTIHSFVSAIRAILKIEEIKLQEDQFLIILLTRACRMVNDKVRLRLPIKKGMLTVLLNQVARDLSEQPYLLALYQALFSTTYFGLLRVGEVTASDHPILVKDVHLGQNKKKVLFVLHHSKTHDESVQPQMVKVSSTPKKKCKSYSDMYCPYKLLKTYICARGAARSHMEQFFVFSDGSRVSASQFRHKLKTTLCRSGFDHKVYDCHSFRIGRCGDLLKLGLSIEQSKP